MHDAGAVAAIAYRDLLKFVRDRPRVLSTLVFPFIFIAALGGALDASFGPTMGYSFITFMFTGVFAQTMFQSSALGIVSLIEDRENDFSQEVFVSPISRYSIIFGKIAGESMVALAQGVAVVLFGVLLGVPIGPQQALGLAVTGVAVCLVGGAFGVVLMANLGSQRAAQQLFPFVFLPQFFLAGVFNPINQLPIYLEIPSRLSPLRYAVDLVRAVYYRGQPEYPEVVVDGLALNAALMAAMFAVFLVAGTWLFVRNERNR